MTEIEIVEVGARDGLQNEKVIFDTEDKLKLINDAIAAGARRLEVASFVHPKRVPQMADAEAVIAGLDDNPECTYIGLVLNKRGYFRAVETKAGGKRGVDEVGAVAIASDTFAEKNQGQTSAESVEISKDIVKLAKADGLSAQITISASFGCPFEGAVDADHVIDMVKSIAEAEPREIALADTIGVGGPGQVADLFNRAREAVPHIPFRAHFHNTRGTGIANAWAAYQAGVHILDASIGGLGGCPFAPKATGNIGTEDLVFMLERSGIKTDLSLDQLITLTEWVAEKLGRPTPSAVSQAGGF
ncbi:hydroxymethylglutaryl-CoA lyase [Kordiimonas sp. SCSIO 12610]|uniref:hydroxymethylglutaryl-CoA lyase n=1 Tax=Kordiimonas sp. SCSIO 12610 TaxID=2829597 RepID=UPI00210990B7|nr:hydroxymethylglutaryl-CoA lyase [Kordiimonas sp. SCSIO 12610]UTW54511.1 hydroxymethylglutaryl-CoA lyase [Kordiimonas sp. SCSIO 12610]